ncbi:MAG: hypothetical protein ACYDGY_07555 [Acidimicrobiales bacterium]
MMHNLVVDASMCPMANTCLAHQVEAGPLAEGVLECAGAGFYLPVAGLV